eukprot:9039109-Pyramimonas_sp.AAC.1
MNFTAASESTPSFGWNPSGSVIMYSETVPFPVTLEVPVQGPGYGTGCMLEEYSLGELVSYSQADRELKG